MDKQLKDLRRQVGAWRDKLEYLEGDNEFLKRQALDAKRKNKLLKTAIHRMQLAGMGGHCPKCAADRPPKEAVQEEVDKNQFFITEQAEEQPSLSRKRNQRVYQSQAFPESVSTRLNETSLLDPASYLNLSLSGGQSTRGSPKPLNEAIKVDDRVKYTLPPTENPKFEQFLDLLLLDASLTPLQAKDEILKFVKALETNYSDSIRGLKERAERLQKKLRAAKSEKINEAQEKTDLEQLFVSCIEEVRREVMRRRFRAEVANRKTSAKGIVSDDEAREFEESLFKLGQLQRKKVKAEDFSGKDRFVILDLFVNNEKTLLKIYEALFQKPMPPANVSINQLASSQASLVTSPRDPRTPREARLPSIKQLGEHVKVTVEEKLASSRRLGQRASLENMM